MLRGLDGVVYVDHCSSLADSSFDIFCFRVYDSNTILFYIVPSWCFNICNIGFNILFVLWTRSRSICVVDSMHRLYNVSSG